MNKNQIEELREFFSPEELQEIQLLQCSTEESDEVFGDILKNPKKYSGFLQLKVPNLDDEETTSVDKYKVGTLKIDDIHIEKLKESFNKKVVDRRR
jgi:hypothetical protein